MSESTLALSYNDLNAEVGHFLGYGRGNTPPYTDAAWDTRQKQAIESCVRSGLRNFYFPVPADGKGSSHDWSFLRPLAVLTLLSGNQTLALPDDFGGIEGQITLAPSASQAWFPLNVVGEGLIRHEYTRAPVATGRPRMVAVQPVKGTTATAGQRFQLFVFPQPDTNYQIQVDYYINPDCLSGAFPYAYGGMQHAETLLESCLAVAETRLDDAATVHTQAFQQRLLASINMDRRLKPQRLGYNGDDSDNRDMWNRRMNHGYNGITVNGTQY